MIGIESEPNNPSATTRPDEPFPEGTLLDVEVAREGRAVVERGRVTGHKEVLVPDPTAPLVFGKPSYIPTYTYTVALPSGIIVPALKGPFRNVVLPKPARKTKEPARKAKAKPIREEVVSKAAPKGPMKEGECRVTVTGRIYCMVGGRSRFQPKGFKIGDTPVGLEKQEVKAVKEGEKLPAQELRAVKDYIERIRNPSKRQYAEEWLKYLQGKGSKPEIGEELSYMAAQSVRMRLAKLTGLEESEQE